MKTKLTRIFRAVIFLLISTLCINAGTQVYDLKTDWSDTQNPNGTWSYLDGNYRLLINDPFPWTIPYAYDRISRTAESGIIAGYLELGDIFVVHRVQSGVVARWTAPGNGTINVSGTTWPAWWDGFGEESPASFFWALNHNGSALSSGITYSPLQPTIQPTRDMPLDLSSGSGGATSLQNITVQAGDWIDLKFFDSYSGTVQGVNFTITFTSDSVDPVASIENLALTVVEMNLQNGISNSLDGKLDAAVSALNDANVNNDGAACNSLAAFISAVEAQRAKKITNAQADQLIAAAQQIRTALNCGN